MTTDMTWPADARSAIDTFLDRVDQVLLHRGIARAERVAIVGELESQIALLVTRKIEEGQAVSLELVQGVIEGMDPPSSYADVEATRASGEQPTTTTGAAKTIKQPTPRVVRRDPVAIVAISLLGLSLLLLPMAFADRRGHDVVPILFTMLVPMSAAFGLGLWSLRRIRLSEGWLEGLPLAFIATCGLPIAIANLIILAVLFSRVGLFLATIAMIGAVVYGNVWLVRRLWRKVESEVQVVPTQTTKPVSSPTPETMVAI